MRDEILRSEFTGMMVDVNQSLIACIWNFVNERAMAVNSCQIVAVENFVAALFSGRGS